MEYLPQCVLERCVSAVVLYFREKTGLSQEKFGDRKSVV